MRAAVAQSMFPSQNVKSTSSSERFWKMRDAQKVHAVVVRSTFSSQNAQSPPCSEHFWTLRCAKGARCRGAKMPETHMEVKTYKTHRVRKTFGSWDVEKMQVKSVGNWRSRTTFGRSDVEKVHPIVVRSSFASQKCEKLAVSDHFWMFRSRKSAPYCGAKHVKSWRSRATFRRSDVEEVSTNTNTSTSTNTTNAAATTTATTGHCNNNDKYTTTTTATTLQTTATATTTLTYATLVRLHESHYTNYKLHSLTTNYTTLITLHSNCNYNYGYDYASLHFPSLHCAYTYTTIHCAALHYNYNYQCHYHYKLPLHLQLQYTTTTLQLQLQLQLHYNYNSNSNYTTLLYKQLQIRYDTTSSRCASGDHCNHSKKHNSNHLSVHQCVRSDIHAWQQLTSPIGFLSLKVPPPPWKDHT